MTRRRWVYIDGEAYEVGVQEPPSVVAPMVMGDIQPYRSMADGTMIESRSQHREMLKRNGCQEIGNEALKHGDYYKNLQNKPAAQRRKEMLIRQIGGMSQREFKQAIKRDADNVKWNSRTD